MAEGRRRRVTLVQAWARANVLTLVLIIVILLSTALSGLTIGAIYRLRAVVRMQLETTTAQVCAARGQTIHYDFPIQHSFPISTTVQLNESLDVPVNIIVPIRQRISVPVDVPVIGQVELPVNLNFDVPIATTVRVTVNKEIPIRTSVNLHTEVPLDIDLGQPPLGDALRQLEEALRELLLQL